MTLVIVKWDTHGTLFKLVLRKHSHSYTSRGFTLYERGQGGASELKYRRERKAKDTT